MSVMMGGSENCHPFHNKIAILSKGEEEMIEVTRLNNTKLIINAELIEKIEESPDTIITLTSGSKIIVKESRQEVKNLVILYKKEILCREL
jgi:flagellar protein FlbD